MRGPKSVKLVISVFIFWMVSQTCSNNKNVTTGMERCCGCTASGNGQVSHAFSCSVSSWDDLLQTIPQPQQVHRLEITIHGVPKMRDGLFSNFTELKTLSLRTQFWENGAIFKHLPSSVSTVEVTGVSNWMPDHLLLRNKNLNVIKGASFSWSCTNCTLQRNYTYQDMSKRRQNSNDFSYSTRDLRKKEFFYGVQAHCRGHMYRVTGNATRYITSYGFFPRCISELPKCFISEIESTPIHRCYEMDNKILNVIFVTGPVALLLNLLTFLTIFLTNFLRKKASMLLVANMATGDFLNSFYAISLVVARKVSYIHFIDFMETFCKIFGFIWLLGQASMIFTSLILTVERYCVLIFVMRPDRKLTNRHVLYGIAVSWVFALILSLVPFMGIGTYTGNTFCVPVRPIRDTYYSYQMTLFIGFIGILLYFISIALYVHIFVFVRKSNPASIAQREHTMAKRIALLVFSNMFFYFTPILIGVLWVTTDMAKKMTPIAEEILTGAIPFLLFSFNSLLNPLFYAYRSKPFLQALKGGILRLKSGKTSPFVASKISSNVRKNRQIVVSSVTPTGKNHVRFALRERKT